MPRVTYKKFSAQYAGCIEYASMPLDNQGLVFIQGENRDEGDSNGSGKSTLFELLATCTHGKTTKSDRRVKKTDLLNVHHPTDFLLQLDLNRQDEDYTIKQFRAHSKLGTGMKILKGLTDITPDDPRDAQKAAQALIGLSWNEYLGSVYLSQRYTHMMIDGTPAQKREYLSRYFGLDTLDTMIKETTKRLNGIPMPDESHLKGMLESVEKDLADIGNSAELQENLDLLLENQKKLQGKLVNLKVEQSKQEDSRASEEPRKVWRKALRRLGLTLDLDTLKTKVSCLRKALSASESSLASAKKRDSLQASLTSLLSAGVVLDLPLDEVEATIEELSSSVSELERFVPKYELKEKLLSQFVTIPEPEEEEEVLVSKTAKWKAQLKDVQESMAGLQSELSKLSSVGDVCYTCQRPISAEEKAEMVKERTSMLAGLKKSLSKAQEYLAYYSENLANLQQRAEIVQKLSPLPAVGSSAELSASISASRKRLSELYKASTHLAKLQSLRDQIADLPVTHDHVSDLEAQVVSMSDELDTIDSAYRWLLQHGTVEFDAQAAQRTNGAVANTEAKLSELNNQMISVQEKLARCKGLKRQRSDLKKTLNNTSAEKQRHRVLKYLTITLGELKKNGLRESTSLLSSVLPLYLNQLFPDGSIQLSVTDDADGFDLMFNKGGFPIPLTAISGGQAKRVGLAIIFAFAKMSRNTTNLLICDEPFRDLDQKGREACFEVLRDFDMGTILVTSHDMDMKSSKKYDKVWRVVMENHVSRLYLD